MTLPKEVLQMSKHTPGPWDVAVKLTASENHRGYRILNGWFCLAEVIPVDTDGIEGGANARLMAAAPDLLDACERAERLFDSGPLQFSREHVSELSAIRTAIKKAKGEA